MYLNSVQKKIGCFDCGYVKFILALEVNCISNLSPNHTLQLTTLRTYVRVTTTTLKNVIKAGDPLTDVQWLLYLLDHGFYSMLFDTSMCYPFIDVWLLTVHDPSFKVVWEASSPVVLCNQQNI